MVSESSNKNNPGKVPFMLTFHLASMSSLLSPLVSRQQVPDERVGLQKQVQRLSEMLHESEDKVAALRSQEKVSVHPCVYFYLPNTN